MPKPKKGESREQFVERCMGDEEAQQSFPDEKQRLAFCEARFDEKGKDGAPGFDSREVARMMSALNEAAVKKLQIRMVGDDTAEVLLYDMIGGGDPFFGGGISATTFSEQIKAIKAKTINLRVNSPGGDVFEAGTMIAAMDRFRSKKGRIVVDVDGLAASAASYLIMASDEIRIGTNAMLMIHDPHTLVIGGAEKMRATADTLDKVKGQILDAYERKSKAGRDRLSAWMVAETWFTGREAVDAGLADSVTEPVRVAALAQHAPLLAKLDYRHAPKLPEDAAAWEATRRRAEIAAKLKA